MLISPMMGLSATCRLHIIALQNSRSRVAEVGDARVDVAGLRSKMLDLCMFRNRAYFEVEMINMSVCLVGPCVEERDVRY